MVDASRVSPFHDKSATIVVVGAGIAGLTAAALLAHSGRRVAVIERHTVAGGCASFYQRGGYRFDVGATLVGGFGPRGVHRRIFAALGVELPATPVEPSMVVQIGGETIVRWGDARWRDERRRAFGAAAEPFWERQEQIADAAWDLSTRFPALPVDAGGMLALLRAARPRQWTLAGTLGRTIGDILPPDAGPLLRAFVDAQLLITAQADAATTDLAYGATALDLAREGTFHLTDGVSAIATALARVVRRAGGTVAYGREVEAIEIERGRVRGVRLADGTAIAAESVIAAVPLANLRRLLGDAGTRLDARVAALPQRWGAFMTYAGVPPGVVPDDLPPHHQLYLDPAAPMGEGNTVFVSFSEAGNRSRARDGGRAVTLSTHTDVARWERARELGRVPALTAELAERLRAALERVVPGAWDAARVRETATPFTFERYTGRDRGLVGGVPQTVEHAGLLAPGHRTGIAGLWACGDTTFPGQSTVGASLSGVAAARAAAGSAAIGL